MRFAAIVAAMIPGRCAMYEGTDFEEYMSEIRDQVCTRCVERPPGGPPCAPLGKHCGIELDLPALVAAVHRVRSNNMEPYIDHFHGDVCMHCANRDTTQCPCPLEFLLVLAVQAIEAVDQRRAERVADVSR
jgi:hypothetical protein